MTKSSLIRTDCIYNNSYGKHVSYITLFVINYTELKILIILIWLFNLFKKNIL